MEDALTGRVSFRGEVSGIANRWTWHQKKRIESMSPTPLGGMNRTIDGEHFVRGMTLSGVLLVSATP
jgi:hypothetical protein